ncbi:hypothetical protein CAY60_007830 [Shouchella clausii]|jgi:hypothetical protein|uniref:Sodium:proton antiporter n=2 Tax=Shouchella TaxID=2893057 RepID=A0A268P4W1_SHOCL|nr:MULTISPECIES: hypothetical protein [Shouchella]MCM3312496.1 hypothetical protein [Psychrobacillus sp. MER TA 17]ALA51104.1 hypothetical protein DB29_00276 [Shouchella clausii]KKI86267.1 hypothetical protein WZ76_11415 [Shouchella clausii]MBU3231900.1 hypothetical protein [Shouchella clausii]MBU3264816.1 hypothetical protein [Shouchella clausii]
MRQVLVAVSTFIAILAICKYRYRLLNAFLRQPLLRRLAVRAVLRMPFVRNRIMPTLFTRPAEPTELYKEKF